MRRSFSSADAMRFVRVIFFADRYLLSFHSPKRQALLSQKKPALLSVTSPPQRGHLPTTGRPEGNRVSAPWTGV